MAHIHWDRRAFLRDTALLVPLAPLLGLACKAGEKEEKPPGIEFLSPVQYRTLLALIETVLPRSPELPDPLGLKLPEELDRFLRREPEEVGSRIRDALLFVEWSPKLSRYFRTFSELTLEQRRRFFRGYARSILKLKRGIYLGLKGLILFFYADHPEVWPAMGYDGPWVRGIEP